MKRSLCSFLLLVLAFSSRSQTVDEVIKKYVDALGGPEKLASIKTVKMTGALAMQGLDVGIIITSSHGAGYRIDISVPGVGDGFQIYTPDKGWSYLPFQGQTSVEEMTADQVKAGLPQLDLQGQLYNYKEKGNKVELLGKETLEGVECYKLTIESSAGKTTTVFLDSKTYYRIKTITVSAKDGQTIETLYSNYKKTEDGFLYPFSLTNPNGTIEFQSIEVNKPVDVSLFKG